MSDTADKAFNRLITELGWMIDNKGCHNEPRFRNALDAYIDARIAEKAPKPFPVTMVTAKDFDAAGEHIRAGTPLMPKPAAPPTAREVHEAWSKWYGKGQLQSFDTGVLYVSMSQPPSFPELET